MGNLFAVDTQKQLGTKTFAIRLKKKFFKSDAMLSNLAAC